MPVTTTATEMVARVRGGSGAATATEVAELLGYATAQIEQYLGDAYATTPDAVLNEAARRIVGYSFDRPAAARYTSYAAVLRFSGAGEALVPYRVHRAGSTANGDRGNGDGGGGGIDADAVNTLIDDAITALDIPGLIASAVAAGGSPPQTLTVPITTAQLKTLDTDYVELIPTPGIGQFVQVLQVWIHKMGDDDPLETGTDNAVAGINNYGEYAMLFVADDTPAKPWGYWTGNYESVWVSNFADLLRLPDSSITAGVIGGHGLGENQPLVLGFTPGLNGTRYYTAAAFDEFMGPVNDAILTVFLRYAVHSIYQFQ